MFIVSKERRFKFILVLALLHSSTYIGLWPQGFSALRIAITFALILSGTYLLCTFIQEKKRIQQISTYFKITFLCLIFWSTFTVLRSFSLYGTDFFSLFGHYLMGWAWFAPLGITFGLNVFNWVTHFRFFSKMLLIGILLSILSLFFENHLKSGSGWVFLQGSALEFLYLFPVLFITYPYQVYSNRVIAILSALLFALMNVEVSQRTGIIHSVIVLFFALVEFYTNAYAKIHTRVFVSLFVISSCLIVFLYTQQNFDSFERNPDVSTDTRSFLFEELFLDFSLQDAIIGRGALGTYYSPFFASWQETYEGGDSSTRQINEVGYLHMILKGGSVMMILYLMILIPAAYLGIFKSNNFVARMCGYYVLSYVLLWSVSYAPTYSARFILVWMAAGTCISRAAREVKTSNLINSNKYNVFKS